MDKVDELLTEEERPLRALLALHGYTLRYGVPDDDADDDDKHNDTDINLYGSNNVRAGEILAYRRTQWSDSYWYLMFAGPAGLNALMEEEEQGRLTLAMITRALVGTNNT